MKKKLGMFIAAALTATFTFSLSLSALELEQAALDSAVNAGDAVQPPLSQDPIFTMDNLQFPQGEQTRVVIPDESMQEIKTLQQGTFLIRFTPETSGIQSLLRFSDSRVGYPNS